MFCLFRPSAIGNTPGVSLFGSEQTLLELTPSLSCSEPVGAWEWKDASGDWLPLPPTAAEIADEAQRSGVPNTIIDLGSDALHSGDLVVEFALQMRRSWSTLLKARWLAC